ncbi:unnamed protein product [Chondrus crispus]|uniref:Uncharacterized protein n=1 Tax=Chondrus crispus TaxID=2769 RepID=R7QKW7_CHOCR|nr:unnamed protein product [Chondrus crispus]CDF38413.1 unnamed protein product [Chondrus crispus]|eukprot:XP_005718306.1 unnamed protein product [Chondrus crispus]
MTQRAEASRALTAAPVDRTTSHPALRLRRTVARQIQCEAVKRRLASTTSVETLAVGLWHAPRLGDLPVEPRSLNVQHNQCASNANNGSCGGQTGGAVGLGHAAVARHPAAPL